MSRFPILPAAVALLVFAGSAYALGPASATALSLAAAALAVVYRERAGARRSLDEKRYRVLESIPDGFFILDDQWRFSHVNERTEQFLRRDAGELIGRHIESILDPLASELLPEMQTVRRHGLPLERLQHFSATNRWVEIRMQPAEDEILVYLRDVTERKRAEMLLTESERRFRLLLQQVPAMLWTVDMELRFTSVLGGELATYGLREDDLLGRAFDALLEGDREKDEHRSAMARVFAGESVRYEFRRGERWLRNDIEPLRDAEGQTMGAIGVALDITEMKESAENLSRLAREDAMTHLPNRLALEEDLGPLLESAERERRPMAVLFLDLDRFKTINDTLGHRSGDDVLRAVGARLREKVGARARVYRPGGDEFVIVVHDVYERDEILSVVNDVLDAFAKPFAIDGRELFVTSSVGASLFPANATTVGELIKQADSAMYHAKEAGRSTAKFYDGTIHARVLERLSLEQDLRSALSRQEFHLVFQPLVDIPSRRITAAETLLRWNHPLLGEVAPDRFISIAEELGIIVEISAWVLREACRYAAAIRENGHPEFRIAVNLSARDLYESSFVDALAATLEEFALPAHALDLEVTEHVLLSDTAVRNLNELRAMGVRVVIDDFGIGYSSLEYVKRLPVGAIKIDKSFVRDVTRNPYDQAIVKAIATLGKTLGVAVIAEGIETAAQYDFVAALHCDQAQGFYFSRPIEIDRLMDVLPEPDGRSSRVVSLFRAGARP